MGKAVSGRMRADVKIWDRHRFPATSRGQLRLIALVSLARNG